MSNKTYKICLIGILTAAYCVLSALMKFTIIGNIQLDLGYIALAVACAFVGPWAAVVGGVGCALESLLFSAYGFSPSWFVGNLIIGAGCGLVFSKTENKYIRAVSVFVFVAVGILLAKTGIECYLYHIPFAVKIVKNLVASVTDFTVMMVGCIVAQYIPSRSVRSHKVRDSVIFEDDSECIAKISEMVDREIRVDYSVQPPVLKIGKLVANIGDCVLVMDDGRVMIEETPRATNE